MTDNDGTQERAAQTMPGRDELRDAIGRVVALHKSEYDWYDDPGAVVEERITGVLSEIAAAGFEIVASDRLDRLRVWAEYAERADDRGRFTKAYRPTVMLQPGDLSEVAGGG